MRPASRPRPVFLAPHYDDVALSCGGTVAASAEAGEAPLIVTVFGGTPRGQLSTFARDMHEQWGVGPHDAVATRQREEACAAARLGAETFPLDFLDAIYRDARYTSDAELFGEVAPAEAGLPEAIERALLDALDARGATPAAVYVPLGVGHHVDHQLVLAAGQRLARDGYEVWAYEDFPYAGDPGGAEQLDQRVDEVTTGRMNVRLLTPGQLDRRVDAILCYQSQLAVIFRRQGDPAEASRRYARAVGDGQPAERCWQPRG